MTIWKKGNWILFPFVITLDNVNMATTQGFVVDNSPLGVEAADKAGLECNITDTTPLDINNDSKV